MSDQKSLVELAKNSATLEEMLIMSGGEMTAEIEDMLTVKDIQLPAKIDSYALVMDRMESISRFYEEKAEFYQRLSRAADNVIVRCKENLKFAMITLHEDEIVGFDVKFKLVKSNPSCIIEDELKIDPAYTTVKTVVTVDKKRITEDLKLGIPVAHAHLEQGVSLRKFANSPGKSKGGSK